MKTNLYIIVFGAIAAIVVLAALSTLLFNKNLAAQNITLSNYGQAPNIRGIAAWINSQPLNLTQLRGKVVLIDFWTYSCINCIRTIPYLNGLYAKYGNDGLVIIGVHTPEFSFEKNYTNVLTAVKKFGIMYPVALDSNYSTWDAYNNEYWPADYLINANGTIVYEQFGEGNYAQTELAIRQLLSKAGYTLPATTTNFTSTTNFSGIGTPEIYLGYARERGPLGNQQGFKPNQTVDYTITNITQANIPYMYGEWYNAPDGMVAVNGSELFLIYKARYVNVVASGNNSKIYIGLDGKPLNQSSLGSDDQIVNGSAFAIVNSPRLYNIVGTPTYGVHELEIAAQPGFKIYTFTFG